MRAVCLGRLGAVIGLAALVMFSVAPGAGAQDQPKIEIVPNIPHSGSARALAFSTDGTLVLSGSLDMKLWDVATGALLRTFGGHNNLVYSAAFSPDGRSVLSGGGDMTLKLRDALTGALLRTFEGHSHTVNSVAFSPDGSRVLSGSTDSTVRLWDAATGALVHTFGGHTNGINSVAFSPDGSRVLSGGKDKTLKLWEVATGALVHAFEGHSDEVNSVAFSPNGSRVLSGSSDRTLKLWDATTGALLHTLEGHSDKVNGVAFSPDGSQVLSGSKDKMLKLWDAATGTLLQTFEGLPAPFYDDVGGGSRVPSANLDGMAKLWDAINGTLARSLDWERSSTVESVALSPNGSRVLSGGRDGVRLWDATTGTLVRTFAGNGRAVLSPDGKRVVSSRGGETMLWDAETGDLQLTLRTSVGVFSPDGKRVVSGISGGTITLWDANTGAVVRTFKGHDAVEGRFRSTNTPSVAISADGSRVLSGGRDKTLRLWDVATGALLQSFKGHTGWVTSVAFSPDGSRVLSGSTDSTVRLWDAATGALLHTFKGHTWIVSSVAFSPDGGRVLSGSWDSTLKLWDVTTGAIIRTFWGHYRDVNAVVFSADGRLIVSGSSDTTTRIWDAATGAQLAALIPGRDGQWLAITPMGFFAGSPKGTDMLSVVRGLKAYSVMQFYDHLHRPDLVEEALKGDPEGKYKDASRRLNLETILDSGPAPEIQLLPNRTEKRGETLNLAVRIADVDGGGIGPKVLWRVNGKTLGATAPPSFARPVGLGDYVIMEQTFTVDPSKKNEVEIIAYNGKGLLATQPLRFSVDAWGVAEKERPRLFVLAMGVDKYAKADWQLRYATKDAAAFADALKAVGTPLFSEVQVKTLIDTEVTERGIAAEFERLAATVKARDVFVLFLGGHGRSIAGEGWFYIPQDLDLAKGHTIEKNAIGPTRLRDWLAKVPAEKSLIVLDACESGASEAFRGGDRERETVMAQLEYSTGRNYIAAAPAGKAAYEGHKGHGVLTYAILEALHRPAGAEADTVSVFGLATHISREVPLISQATFGFRQQPRFTPTGDDFPLGIRTAVLKADEAVPKTPTHMLVRAERVRERPASDAQSKRELTPGTMLRVIEFEAGWAAIARDGERLGYVPAEALLKMQ